MKGNFITRAFAARVRASDDDKMVSLTYRACRKIISCTDEDEVLSVAVKQIWNLTNAPSIAWLRGEGVVLRAFAAASCPEITADLIEKLKADPNELVDQDQGWQCSPIQPDDREMGLIAWKSTFEDGMARDRLAYVVSQLAFGAISRHRNRVN